MFGKVTRRVSCLGLFFYFFPEISVDKIHTLFAFSVISNLIFFFVQDGQFSSSLVEMVFRDTNVALIRYRLLSRKFNHFVTKHFSNTLSRTDKTRLFHVTNTTFCKDYAQRNSKIGLLDLTCIGILRKSFLEFIVHMEM